jgi:hypothetical protein
VDRSPEPGPVIRALAHHPQPHSASWPVALLVAWAVALTGVTVSAHHDVARAMTRLISGLGSASRPGSPSAGQTWSFDLPSRARTSVDADLSAIRPATRPLLRRLAGMVSIDDHVALCRPPASSCSSSGSGEDGRWGVHLDGHTTASTYPSNRFLVYHEIGHAEWGLLLGTAGRHAFATAVSRALGGRPCINDQGRPCAVLPEMFADEFARFVGGFAVSMSYYCTPPLLDADAFGALVHVGAQPDPHPHMVYAWRPAYVRGKVALIRIRADAANVREDRGITDP